MENFVGIVVTKNDAVLDESRITNHESRVERTYTITIVSSIFLLLCSSSLCARR